MISYHIFCLHRKYTNCFSQEKKDYLMTHSYLLGHLKKMAELLRMYNMITYIKGRGPLQYTANRRLPNVKYPFKLYRSIVSDNHGDFVYFWHDEWT